MNKYLTYFLLIVVLLLSACGGDEPAPTPTPTAAAEAAAATATAVPPTTTPTETAVPPTATAQPTATETAVPPTAAPTETAVPPTATPEPAPPTNNLTSAFEPAGCEFDEPDGYEVECGFVTVPEDHTNPENGREVRLHVAIFAGSSGNPAPDPIVYLEGGPGGDALETIPLVFAERFSPFLAYSDFIMFDQRGTGYSEPSLACPEYTDLTYESLELDVSVDEEVALVLEAFAECHARLLSEDINLSVYNSAQNAADVAALRVALGYEEWNLFGISYGTRLAQTIMRDHPEGIRSVILDSSYPIDADLVTEISANANRAFDTFFAGCAADPACSEAYPDLETVFYDLVDRLDAEPVETTVTNFFTGEQYDALIGGDDLVSVLFQALYAAEIIPELPKMIYELEDGNPQNLGLLLSSFLLNTEFFSIGMQYSVQCHEEIVFSEPGDGAAAAADFPETETVFGIGADIDDQVCAFWGAGTAAAQENEAISSDLPTLILAGEYDPITPPAWGQQVAAGLSNHYYYEFPGLGHGVSISGECPFAVTLDFLEEPAATPDAGCIADMGGPDFFVAGANTDDEIVLVPFTADLFGTEVNGVVPEGWEEAGPGVYGRGQSGLDQTALVQQAAPGISADFLLSTLAGQLGLEENPESSGEFAAETLTWTLYEAELQGLPVDIALAEDEDYAYIVMLISNPDERDFLFTAVFEPVLEALNIP